jgi:hypothetical protein
MGSQNFKTISASHKIRKPTFLVELENGHYDYTLSMYRPVDININT